MSQYLRVNPILCDAYGSCAELLPELIHLDEWGYPIVDDEPVPPQLARKARRAVGLCPRLALLLEDRQPRRRVAATAASNTVSRSRATGPERTSERL